MTFLRAPAALLGGAAIAAGLVWACSSSRELQDGERQSLSGRHSYALGTCSVGGVLEERPEGWPDGVPLEPAGSLYRFEPQPVPAERERLSKVVLTVTLEPNDAGHLQTTISAEVAQQERTGTLSFLAGIRAADDSVRLGVEKFFLPDGTVLSMRGRAFERRSFLAGGPSSLRLGDREATIDVAVLHWESTGDQWLLLGRRHVGGRTDLVASAAHCSFDVAAWKLLRDARCVDALYDDTDRPLPVPEAPRDACQREPSDTFDAFHDSIDAGYVVGPWAEAGSQAPPDAGTVVPPPPSPTAPPTTSPPPPPAPTTPPPSPPSPPSEPPAQAADASTTAPETPSPPQVEPDASAAFGDPMLPATTSDDDPEPPPRRDAGPPRRGVQRESGGGCGASPASPGEGAPLGAAPLLVVAALAARARSRRRRA